MDLSIIIVNYKTPQITYNCIESLKIHTKNINFEIIVVDNASEDDSKEKIMQAFPGVKWIDSGYNAGFSRANNIGIENAQGNFVVLLNSDTLLLDNIFLTCINRLKIDNSIGACSVNFLDRNKSLIQIDENYTIKGMLQYAYVLFNKLPFFSYWLNYWNRNAKNAINQAHTDFLVGAFILTRKQNIEQVGGLDNDLFLYGEDISWSCELAKTGKLTIFEDLSIIHLEGGSTKKNNTPETFFSKSPQMQLSNLVWIRKHIGLIPFLSVMLDYWVFIPIYFVIRLLKVIVKPSSLVQQFLAPIQFCKQVFKWSRYLPSIIFKRPNFYKY